MRVTFSVRISPGPQSEAELQRVVDALQLYISKLQQISQGPDTYAVGQIEVAADEPATEPAEPAAEGGA